ncbi:hypothetical protein EJ03DRAFT_328171 [Teratosphaeria nubilosa]|uniref:Prokaryotic-type class I peptide chain release factors domain-containing protein n=1 Tax=Teratosphaeria nubilosa TaxID=161662 RepID=A0A6G1L7A3_9PEZI|nr:hypothetical protein EJ03DRAFT_328171 [Teratosphaeria nubilosa]
MLRYLVLSRPFGATSRLRSYATKRGGDASEEELDAARKWLAKLDPDTIPRNICDISFSRSSGPGGQNVNKVSSKATLRIPLEPLLSQIPPLLHPAIKSSRYSAGKSNELVIQADDARKQNDNVNSCFKRLHELIVEAGRAAVPGETSQGQKERVEMLQKAEAAGRRRMKEFQSKKKSARRGGRGGDD